MIGMRPTTRARARGFFLQPSASKTGQITRYEKRTDDELAAGNRAPLADEATDEIDLAPSNLTLNQDIEVIEMRRILVGLIGVAFILLASEAPRAQQAQQMPPALQAAIASGNADAVQRVIATLAAGNSARTADLALMVINAAEARIATNPSLAASLASAAINSVATSAVIGSSPQQALNISVIAARITSNPSVQSAAPSVVGNIAASNSLVASAPSVFNISPTAALQVMSDSYNTASSPSIAAANPGATARVTQTLVAASNNPALNASFQQSGATIAAILTKQPLPDTVRDTIVARGTAS